MSTGTFVSWPLFRGCSLTKLENQLRIREGKPAYDGQCIGHYLAQLTGVRLNRFVVNLVLVGFMLIPVAVQYLLK